MSNTLKAKAYALMIAFMLGIAQVVSAGPIEEGLAAAKSGDFATALRLLRPIANQGNASAQLNLGGMYYRGQGVQQNYAEAAKWYRLAAYQGNATAQLNLGGMYYMGQGVPQDYLEAHKWATLAVAGGEKKAAENLRIVERRMTREQIARAQ
jgi:TPR repeat protein